MSKNKIFQSSTKPIFTILVFKIRQLNSTLFGNFSKFDVNQEFFKNILRGFHFETVIVRNRKIHTHLVVDKNNTHDQFLFSSFSNPSKVNIY